MSSRNPPVQYFTVPWGGRDLVPVEFVADGLISLLPVRDARKALRQSTVTLISPGEWAEIQSDKGAGLNVDPAYIR